MSNLQKLSMNMPETGEGSRNRNVPGITTLITTLPAEIAFMPELYMLTLSNNRLTSHPVSIWLEKLEFAFANSPFDQTKSSKVELSNNQLTDSVWPQLVRLTKVKLLLMTGNNFSHIPSEVGRLTRLTKLTVGGNGGLNAASTLPTELGRLTSITHLQLEGLGITSIPPSISRRLTQLQTLILDGNSITEFPSTAMMPKLTSLQLRDNDLTWFPARVLAAMPNISTLILRGNALTWFPAAALAMTPKLLTLDLHDNHLVDFESPANHQRDRISILNHLSDLNHLSEVGLNKLVLSQNRLTAVPTFVGQLQHLEVRWKCCHV